MREFYIERFINSSKLAVLEDGKIEELIIDDKVSNISVKDVYSGKVVKLLKSMDACFIDIGNSQLAYLKYPKNKKIYENDRLLVQVIKLAKGDKKPSLSLEISLSGRYLVYIPDNSKLVFSNKIEKKEEIDRLKKIMEEISPSNQSFLLRTNAINASKKEIKEDLTILLDRYQKIEKKFNETNDLSLIYSDSNSVDKYIQEHLNRDLNKIVYYDCYENRQIRNIVKSIDNSYLDKLEKSNSIDVFRDYGIENKIEKYLKKTIHLKSGSWFTVEFTEAMTIIDVNSGKYIGHSNYENTIFRVNKECAREIANQIIVRNLYGIVLVDFIDMKDEKQRQEVIDIMIKYLSKSSIKFNIHGFTKLGIMEISRRREGNSLHSYYFDCNKYVKEAVTYSINYIVDHLERKIIHDIVHTKNNNLIELNINKEEYDFIISNRPMVFGDFENKYNIKVEINKI